MDDENPPDTNVVPIKRGRGQPRKTDAKKQADADARKIERQERKDSQDEEKRENQVRDATYFLTPQELRFAQAIVAGRTQEDALREAGFRGSASRAKSRAHRLRQRAVVRAAIYELASRAWDQAQIETTHILREYAFIAFLPPGMLEGKFSPANKLEALKKLGEYQKLFEGSQPGSGPKSILQLIAQAGSKVTIGQNIEQPALERR